MAQVTVKGGAATGLANDATFYFGNAIGESGNDPTNARVTAIDEIAARVNATPVASITNPYDFNRDGMVDGADQLIARTRVTYFLNELQWVWLPVTAAAAAVLAPAIPPPLIQSINVQPSNFLLHVPRFVAHHARGRSSLLAKISFGP